MAFKPNGQLNDYYIFDAICWNDAAI